MISDLTVIGRLIDNPKKKKINDEPATSFTLKTNLPKYKSKDDLWSFTPILIIGNFAKALHTILAKNDLVIAQGTLLLNYDSKEKTQKIRFYVKSLSKLTEKDNPATDLNLLNEHGDEFKIDISDQNYKKMNDSQQNKMQ